MVASRGKQKEYEARILEAARKVCSIFPSGAIRLSEEPDLLIKSAGGDLGVEITELLREDTGPFSPVKNEDFHRKVVRLAEERYRDLDAEPVHVGVMFLDEARCKSENPEGWRRLADRKVGRKLENMANSLVEFVKNHSGRAGVPTTFKKREMPGQMDADTLPAGFEVISISRPPAAWASGESATIPPLDREQLRRAIDKKNSLLPRYRANTRDMPIWLLIYSGPSVSRGVPIPRVARSWRFPFDFEKVLLFSGMDNEVIEISRG